MIRCEKPLNSLAKQSNPLLIDQSEPSTLWIEVMKEETIIVRTLSEIYRFDEAVPVGAVVELPRAEALQRVQERSVEPAFCVTEFVPPIPSKGCTLSEARLLHLDNYPGLQPLFDRLGLEYDNQSIVVRRSNSAPVWKGVRPDAAHDLSLRNSKKVWETRDGSGVQYLKVPIESFESRFDAAYAPRLEAAANHFFVKLFREGKLLARGISEDDPFAAKQSAIPVRWWSKDVVLNGANEMLQDTHSAVGGHTLRWTDIVVFASQSKNQGVRRGVGRPDKLKNEILGELALRATEGRLCDTVSAEKRELHQWASKEHPEKEVPDVESIENIIRSDYKAYKFGAKEKDDEK